MDLTVYIRLAGLTLGVEGVELQVEDAGLGQTQSTCAADGPAELSGDEPRACDSGIRVLPTQEGSAAL